VQALFASVKRDQTTAMCIGLRGVSSVKLGTFALCSRAALILLRLKPLETSAYDPKQTLAQLCGCHGALLDCLQILKQEL